MDAPDMTGKTVVMTGATSGIGEVAAAVLAKAGARIVLVARDPARAEAVLARLRAANPDAVHAVHFADLSRLREMKHVAAEVAAAEPRIDVLVNNAGAVFPRRELTEDGLERTFATNHMAYFVVTLGLLDRLRATPGARIVNTASAAHLRAKLDFDDLQGAKRPSMFGAYSRSKLCNILFTRELARRLEGTGVTANALHPGFVASRFGDGAMRGPMALVFGLMKRTVAVSPERGAETIVHLARAPEAAGVTGGYFADRKPAEPSPAARHDADAARLWAESERILAGMA